MFTLTLTRTLRRAVFIAGLGALVAVAATAVAGPASGQPAACTPLTEGFDNISTLTGAGWFMQNNSTPVGTTGWFQGNPAIFPAQAGADNSYIGANFQNTTGSGTISNWLLTPAKELANNDQFSFYTRAPTGSTFPDRLEVRMSLNGASTNVGTGPTDLGDFTTLLLSINPTLVSGGYPVVWTQFTVTLSGIAAPTTGRLAFRYYVTDGGLNGTNSDYIGIDSVAYTCGAPTAASLQSLRANRVRSGVRIGWRTSLGHRFAGFHVHVEKDGAWHRATPRLIPARSGAGAYSHLVRNVSSGSFRLRAVRLDGSTQWFGPVGVPG